MTWPPGWHPDPTRRFEFRYYNGERWTSDVSVNGQRFVDHLESSQPPGSQPGWAPASQLQRGPSRGFAVAAFWVALASFLCGWVPFIFAIAIVGAITAFVFGVIALRRERVQPARGRGYAIAGIVLAVAALGSSTVGFVLTRSVMREFNAFFDVGPYDATIDSCVTVDGLTTLDGTITNQDTKVHSYTVLVSYRSDNEDLATDSVSVPSVAPGDSGAIHATTFVERATDVECHIDSVNGPQPFDVNP
jgi:hypothetical protein